jgi:uncharacterized membrane-anchored protein
MKPNKPIFYACSLCFLLLITLVIANYLYKGSFENQGQTIILSLLMLSISIHYWTANKKKK